MNGQVNTDGTDWIAADWGTSNLRIWAMQGDTVLAERGSDRGMGTLSAPDEFAAELARLTEGWPAVPVVACGMVGARQGWMMVPYRAVPCGGVPALHPVPGRPGGRDVLIAEGVMQVQPPDVMRGEETQIAGILAAMPGFDGVVCLPGTHTKWVRVSAGEIVNFQTVMTGEIYGLISKQSVLRYSLPDRPGPPDEDAFADAVATAISQPHTAWARLFRLRAEGLIGESNPDIAAARLSGTLIGLDLGAARPHWLGMQVLIIGAPHLAALYETALRAQGGDPVRGDADTTTRAGLLAAWRQYQEQEPT